MGVGEIGYLEARNIKLLDILKSKGKGSFAFIQIGERGKNVKQEININAICFYNLQLLLLIAKDIKYATCSNWIAHKIVFFL